MMSMKRPSMTLDLNGSGGMSSSKKAKLSQILTSPDVQMLKLTSPELAEFLSRNPPTMATPTPTSYLFPKTVTEEQEMYAKGFEEALKKLHTSGGGSDLPPLPPPTEGGVASVDNKVAISTIERATNAHRNNVSSPPQNMDDSNLSRPSSGASGSFDSSSLDGSYVLPEGVQIKEEPGTTSSSKNVEPINMEAQEKIKLERKRLRNRVAASKCRKRKLERISQLDEKVNMLKGENSELSNVVKKLKDAVCNLKQEVLEHVNSGCEIMINEMPAFAE